jgi:predicted nucleotidyltransferase
MHYTINDAHAVSRRLKSASPNIKGIELFGSVSTNGIGHDIDLILIVDENLAHRFWSNGDEFWPDLRVIGGQRWLKFRKLIKKVMPLLDEAFTHGKKQMRLIRASELLGFDLISFSHNHRPTINMDVWLMPSGWRRNKQLNLSVVERMINPKTERNTILFLGRIAASAISTELV